MATFGELREVVFKEAGVRNHFEFMELSPAHREFHREINAAEFKLGYSAEEYLKANSLALCEMDLLSEAHFADWLERFRAISKR